MYLSKLCELAGGRQNLTRVTLDEDNVYLTLKDPALLDTQTAEFDLSTYHGEWVACASRQAPVLCDELFEIGAQIEADLRHKAAEYVTPTACEYRPLWHIAPPQGLLNDPNGFIWHAGEYHLFYQWYPYACEHKDKYWVQLTSPDLVNWHWAGIALTPSHSFDSHGAFSGHALSYQDTLYAFYTGNTRIGPERLRQATQCCAVLQPDGSFKKLGPLVEQLPDGVTPHFRDPKVIRWRDRWMMFVGAQREDLLGRLAVYHSTDLMHWEYQGLFGDELGDYGYMWECPDVFELGGQYYMIFGPQGLASGNPHHVTPHHNRICTVTFDEQGLPTLSDPQPLDQGFDFYAPQSLETPDGRRVMCAWLGLPDEVTHPSVANGWIHQMSGLREIEFVDGKLIQRPVQELETLRGAPQVMEISQSGLDLGTKAFELQVNLADGESLSLFADETMHFDLRYQGGILTADRSATQGQDGDKIRELAVGAGEAVELRILADQSSLEIFVNGGEAVISSRVYTPKEATNISCVTNNREAKLAQFYPIKTPSQPYPLTADAAI